MQTPPRANYLISVSCVLGVVLPEADFVSHRCVIVTDTDNANTHGQYSR